LKEAAMQNVVFKFRRPSGAEQQTPSVAMTEALRRLGESEEMKPLIAEARKSGKSVAIEVFHSQDGQPILIHFAKETICRAATTMEIS
jgi:hypothetical protein